ncbi:hypothetical protein CR513_31032, partial [Mucuna pruriens]
MESSRIRVDGLIINMGSSYFGRGRVKGPEFAISSTTFPTTTTTTESANSRQLTIFGGLDEATRNKQYGVPTKYELQQHAVPTKHEPHHPRPQDANRTVSKYCEPITIGNASAIILRSGKELPHPALQQLPRPTKADSEPDADS